MNLSSNPAPSRTPSELSRSYNERIIQNLRKIMTARLLSQNALVELLGKHGLDINQGTISKYLTGTVEIQLSVIVKLCEIFDLSITDLVREDFLLAEQEISTDEEAVLETFEYADPRDAVLYIPKLGNKFISDSGDLDFRGWIQPYKIYFYPTLSNDPNVLKGELFLSNSDLTGVCEARLTLNTNRTRKDGTPIIKEYTGCAIISTSVHAMYIILSSEEEGELCMLNMRHFFIRHQWLDCRMASVLTNSAGEGHVPTVHRALISREEIRDEDLALLLPQLHLNCSDILIREADLEQLRQQDERYDQLISHLTNLPKPEPVYFFKEDYVRSNALQFLRDKKETLLFLSAVRKLAYKNRYNKVSNKVDEYVHSLLCSLGYYGNSGATL